MRFLLCFLLFLPAFAAAEPIIVNTKPFGLWVLELRKEALEKGVSAPVFDSAFQQAEPIARVIELDRKQPESTLTFEQYMQKVLPQARIDKARTLFRENRELLARTSAEYGV